MLALMDEFEHWPPKWSPATYADHRHPKVRREALRLMLRVGHLRDEAVCGLLEDRDPRSLSLGIAAAQAHVPMDALGLLIAIVGDESVRMDLRRSALRALVPCRTGEVRTLLLSLVRRPGPWPFGWLGWKRLAEKSSLMLEALAGLALAWRADLRVGRLLERAARSSDPEVSAAARGRIVGES